MARPKQAAPAPLTKSIDTFNPEKKTIGDLLSSTNPPILVPDFQRDYSWEQEQVTYFWSDLLRFHETYPTKEAMTGKEYFLGSAVLVNNGDSHLLLDGQQRLATATILLAAIRDKVRPYKTDAAKQFHEQFIVFRDAIDDSIQPKLTLNTFDRDYFSETVQKYPYVPKAPQTRSQQLIADAYQFFSARVNDLWSKAGSNEKAFEKLASIVRTLTRHVAIITVVSFNEDYAAAIFETLNDRGVSLSSTDLLRSFILQKTDPSKRPTVLERWREIFENCGANDEAERLIRISWTAQHGDVKVRSVSKIVKETIASGTFTAEDYSNRLSEDSKLYYQLKKGEFDDDELSELYADVSDFGLRVAYPLFVASLRTIPIDFPKILLASVSLIVRHSVVCAQDRGALETAFFDAAKEVSSDGGTDKALAHLRKLSPSTSDFAGRFEHLKFNMRQHPTAKCLLAAVERYKVGTDEKKVASARKVHVDHIYPQKPEDGHRLSNHDKIVNLVGNLTLLDKRLNEAERNAPFPKKKGAYQKSDIKMTKELSTKADWLENEIVARQKELAGIAEKLWPESLVL